MTASRSIAPSDSRGGLKETRRLIHAGRGTAVTSFDSPPHASFQGFVSSLSTEYEHRFPRVYLWTGAVEPASRVPRSIWQWGGVYLPWRAPTDRFGLGSHLASREVSTARSVSSCGSTDARTTGQFVRQRRWCERPFPRRHPWGQTIENTVDETSSTSLGFEDCYPSRRLSRSGSRSNAPLAEAAHESGRATEAGCMIVINRPIRILWE